MDEISRALTVLELKQAHQFSGNHRLSQGPPRSSLNYPSAQQQRNPRGGSQSGTNPWLPNNRGNGDRRLNLAIDLHGGGGNGGNNNTTNAPLIPPQFLSSQERPPRLGQNSSGAIDGWSGRGQHSQNQSGGLNCSGTGTNTSGTQPPTGSGNLTTSPVDIPTLWLQRTTIQSGSTLNHPG